MPRTRVFKLPGIQNLSKQQDGALALPLNGQHLIIGGPGTGKSVVALLRARRLAQEGSPYRFLVFNHVLHHSNRHLFGDSKSLSSMTWLSWFFRMYRDVFKNDVPKIHGRGQTFQPIDWEEVDASIQALGEGEGPDDLPHLVIDEGQDMPPAFYRTLIDLGFENFYVVADQNQQIHPDQCSSRQDIENALCVETARTLELLENYRNALPVVKLALTFYPDDPASPTPQLPLESRSALTPQLITYGRPGGPTFESILVRILKLGDVNPQKLIGIITPDNKVRERFCIGLTQATAHLDNGRPPIQTYVSGNDMQLDFGQGGIMVLNAQSCKGLEFDTVILADIDRHQPKDAHTLMARFYVMVARARERAILLRTGDTCPLVESLLPTDTDILSRE